MRRLAIFTDLDGTLLGHDDFSAAPAQPLVDRLVERGVPVVPVTSKTMEETVAVAGRLGLPGPLVVESGGAIVRRDRVDWTLDALGVPAARLRDAVPELARAAGARLWLYSDMSDAEAARISGLDGVALMRSRLRRFDEPFLLVDGQLSRLRAAAAELGLTIRTGGRFHHLCGPADKSGAVAILCAELAARWGAPPFVVALGDAPMDADFLAGADLAVVIPKPDGRPDPELMGKVPHARVAPAPGPRGWAAAIEQVWHERRVAHRENGAARP